MVPFSYTAFLYHSGMCTQFVQSTWNFSRFVEIHDHLRSSRIFCEAVHTSVWETRISSSPKNSHLGGIAVARTSHGDFRAILSWFLNKSILAVCLLYFQPKYVISEMLSKLLQRQKKKKIQQSIPLSQLGSAKIFWSRTRKTWRVLYHS